MFFIWSGAVGPMVASFCFVILILLAVFITWAYSVSYNDRSKVVVRNIVIAFLISVVGFNGITVLSSWGADGARGSTAAEIAQQFGAKADTPYKLLLGDRVSGTSGVGTLDGGLFSISGSISMQPDSAVSVGFTSAEYHYILTLPTSSISFKTVADAPPTMTLMFDDAGSYTPSMTTFTHGPCQWGFINLTLQCVKPVTSTTITLGKTTTQGGLSKFITDNPHALTGVLITLTEEQYNQLVKSN